MTITGVVCNQIRLLIRLISSLFFRLISLLRCGRDNSSRISELPFVTPVEDRRPYFGQGRQHYFIILIVVIIHLFLEKPSTYSNVTYSPLPVPTPNNSMVDTSWGDWDDKKMSVEQKIAEYRQSMQPKNKVEEQVVEEPDLFQDLQPKIKQAKTVSNNIKNNLIQYLFLLVL